MAFQQSFKMNRASDGLSIIITDITGAYDATTNPTGYGGPNPAVGDFTALSLSVYLPDPVTLQPQTTPVVITAIYPTLPSETNGTYTITSTALAGSESVLIDGLYQGVVNGTYDIGAGDVAITPITIYKLFYYIAECCWQQNRLETSTCGNKDKNYKLNLGGGLLLQLQPYINSEGVVTDSYIEQCGAWNTGVNFVLYLQEICNEFNCGGGCETCH